MQVTALGQPKLLERVSGSLVAIRDLFRIFDADLNGVVTRDEFDRVRRSGHPVMTVCGGSALAVVMYRCACDAVVTVLLACCPRISMDRHRCNDVQVYSDLFDDATPERMDTLFRYLDKDGTGEPRFSIPPCRSYSRRPHVNDRSVPPCNARRCRV